MQVAMGTLELWVTPSPTRRCYRGQVQAARLQAGLEHCLLVLLPTLALNPFPSGFAARGGACTCWEGKKTVSSIMQ